MRAKQEYQISEPLRTINKGWQPGNPPFETSKVALLLLAFITGYASAQTAKPLAQVPEKLKPSADESLVMIVAAKGVQIYECRARKDAPNAFEWAFVAPQADLLDSRGQTFGTHGAGPFWQAADGSRIEGTVKQRADAPVAGAIPCPVSAMRITT